jgi:lambda family phage portal protein
MLEKLRQNLAQWLAPTPAKKAVTRMYAGARNSRLTAGFPGYNNSSADAELALSLTQLRARSRQLVRDAGYAKRAKVIVVNNVIGAGVGLQAQVASVRENPRATLNAAIEAAFKRWSRPEFCHTGGTLGMADMERALMGQVFEAGEAFVRIHSRAFGGSEIPLALELIEAERVADEYTTPGVPGNVRMGVEQDEFYRPLAYWIREGHPGDLRNDMRASQRLVRVPASEIIHLRIVDRWPQTRGEPWMHAAVTKLHDMDEYSAAELTAARMSANYFGTIESDADDPLLAGQQAEGDEQGPRQINIEPGMIEQLAMGEKLNFHSPNRPNTAIDPFLRYMLREVAAAVGCSYESLSRDYSQSNYSSSRLALLDDRDLWRMLQQWWVRSFREPLHRVWMNRAVMAGAIQGLSPMAYASDMERYQAVRWKLRGWSWVDPTREVNAYKEAVKAGFTTVSKVIEQTAQGDDIEDIVRQREGELQMFADHGIEVDTTVREEQPAPPPAPPPAPAEIDDEDEDPRRRVFSIGGR